MNKEKLLFPILISCLLLLILFSIGFGSVKIPVSEVLACIFGNFDKVPSTRAYIILSMRIPRVITAVLSGGILALGGVVFQSVFQNPMADSYVLGVSSGASFSVALFTVLGIVFKSTVSVPLIAFIGAIGAGLIILIFSDKNKSSMLLTGIALNFFLSALTSLLLFLGKEHTSSILFWSMGSLASASWDKVLILFVTIIVFFIFCLSSTKQLDLLLFDDETAISSGLNVKKTRLVLLTAASFGTAVAVSYCGIIGFVGLMAPHFARLITGDSHKKLIPSSIIIGALILLISDTIARTIIMPSELPVGIVTSIIGAPILFFMLKRSHRK